MHEIIVTYRHWSEFCFVVRGKSVLCQSVVSCLLGLSFVTPPHGSLIYLCCTWGAHTRITDGSISLWGVARSSCTPPGDINALCIFSVTTWDYIFHVFFLFHIMLFIYSCYGEFNFNLQICGHPLYQWNGLSLIWSIYGEGMTAEKSVANVQSHLMGGGVSEQLVCLRSDWYFLEWKDFSTERTGGRCYAHNKTSCNLVWGTLLWDSFGQDFVLMWTCWLTTS